MTRTPGRTRAKASASLAGTTPRSSTPAPERGSRASGVPAGSPTDVPLRILVTGSRDWTDYQRILDELTRHARGRTNVVIVHGHCGHGADYMADHIARSHGWQPERHPADWRRYGKRAGYLRNAEMVEAGADICLAFIRNNSRGATMCADLAVQAGILTFCFMEVS